jgi:hypothetical protein
MTDGSSSKSKPSVSRNLLTPPPLLLLLLLLLHRLPPKSSSHHQQQQHRQRMHAVWCLGRRLLLAYRWPGPPRVQTRPPPAARLHVAPCHPLLLPHLPHLPLPLVVVVVVVQCRGIQW